LDVELKVVFREGYKQKENMKKLQLAVMAAALVIAVQTRATVVFDLGYSDPSGNVVNGQLTASALGGNQYLALSGNINLTSLSNPLFDGTYSLLPGGPGTIASPSGAFDFDNVLYYPSDPIVDFSGVLAFQNSLGVELNLFSTAPGTYALYAWDASSGTVNLYPNDGAIDNVGGPATASLTLVPETTTIIAGALLLLPFGVSTFRILRKNRMA
jgi:hypothetical protein